jgi:hypothetical protein
MEDDLSACLGKPLGDGEAHAARRTGDECSPRVHLDFHRSRDANHSGAHSFFKSSSSIR